MRTNASCNLYLDSGCSRHMTGVKEFLNNYKHREGGTATFSDGSKSNVGIAVLNIDGMPKN